MANFTNITALELAEYFANDHDLISTEQALSDLFDAEVAEDIINIKGIDDKSAMRQAFNDWSDSQRDQGMIHAIQYRLYCYVGKYSTD